MRLERIQREFAERVGLTWKSFLLRPKPRVTGIEKFRRYTQSWRAPAEQPDGGRFRVWASQEPPPSHSVPPNVAVKAAARLGGKPAFDRYHLAIMDAYFYANRDVSDDRVLADVAVQCGLDAGAFAELLGDAGLRREVFADHQAAVESGVTGVPTVVLDGQWQIPGAQSLDFYRHLVRKRLAAGRA